MNEAVNNGLLAATPAWLAVLTLLIGLAAGASAAAVVTTRHERTERFRDRMIQAASRYIEPTGTALLLLERAHLALRRSRLKEGEETVRHVEILLPGETQRKLKVPELDPALQDPGALLEMSKTSLAAAKESIAAARATTPGLYVLFAPQRDRRILSLPQVADSLIGDLRSWAGGLEASIGSGTPQDSLDQLRSAATDKWEVWLAWVNREVSRRSL